MYKHLPSPVNFREDINGLRAWAVIAVLLFHFSLIGLPGGFVGVDIFFVISGYLMTAIVVSKLEKGSFSLLDFYMARVRRILPALLVVIATLLVLGWFWLPTSDYQELGKQSAYSLAFLSNIGYWKSAGYFDGASHEKWLLHTWSLAVEAQFYLLYPVFVALLWKVWPKIRALTIALTILFVLSFVLNIALVQFKPTAAFYLLPTRGWELSAGGIVYLLVRQLVISKANTNLIFWLGWILVFSSMAFITQDLAWPGYWALSPVLGVSLIIFANNQGCKLTNNPIAQWLGDRSYSLYLWHWPLVVALYFASLQSDWLWVGGAFLLSVIFAHISYHLVETPTRSYLTKKTLKKEVTIIALSVMIIGISSVFIKFKDFNNRLPIAVETAAIEILNVNPRRDECHISANGTLGSPGCNYGTGSELGAILIGDSHASASANPLQILASQKGMHIKLWSFSACPTLMDIQSDMRGNDCSKSTNWILNQIKDYPKNIPAVIVNSTYFRNGEKSKIRFTEINQSQFQDYETKYIESFVKTTCEIAKTRSVFIVRPYPKMESPVPQELSRAIMFQGDHSDIKILLKDYKQQTKLVWQEQDRAVKQCGVKLLNPLPFLCDETYCYGSKQGRPLYYDDDHLSEYGNMFLLPMFDEVFK
ncbi:MAG: acyltransferase family protein [Pseudomonadota bacterium]|nr:acyltransferase family protein [Pseudomonadota bacterium]